MFVISYPYKTRQFLVFYNWNFIFWIINVTKKILDQIIKNIPCTKCVCKLFVTTVSICYPIPHSGNETWTQTALHLRPTLLASNRARASLNALESPSCLNVQEKYPDLMNCCTKTTAVIYPTLTICNSPLNIKHYCIWTLHKAGKKFLKKRNSKPPRRKEYTSRNPAWETRRVKVTNTKNTNSKYINKFHDQEITEKCLISHRRIFQHVSAISCSHLQWALIYIRYTWSENLINKQLWLKTLIRMLASMLRI